MSTTTPRKRMPRADRERQMLDVAEAVFTEQGYHKAAMDEIAERCGISKPLLYEYFGSKEGLMLAVVARNRAELYEVTTAAIKDADGPRDMLWRGMLAYFEFMDSHSRALAMTLQEPVVMSATAEAVEEVRRQQSDLIAPIIAWFAPAAPAIAIDAYTEIIIGACERLALWRTRSPELSAADAATYMTDFTWQGLSPYLVEDGPASR